MLRCCGLILLLLPVFANGQSMVEYTPDFKFNDGIYISFEDFKNNNPIPVTHIVSNYDIRDSDYLEQVLMHDSVDYFDNLYEERTIATHELWGFCQRNRVFIGFGADGSFDNPEFFDFYPLVSIGAVSFFTALESYYRTMGPSPMMGVGYDPMYDSQMTVTETEQVQLLLEFKTGKILLAKRGELGYIPVELVFHILQDDPVLLEQFRAISGRDQKQKGMFYIHEFNARNPIFFPVD